MPDCTSCDLHLSKGRCYVKGRGAASEKDGMVIVGDFPLDGDSYTGMPFISAEERPHLDGLLASVGMDRSQVFCTNLVRCSPPRSGDGKFIIPTSTHLDACHTWLDKEISFVKPKVIVLVGPLAVERFLGKKPTPAMMGRAIDSAEVALVFKFSDSGETQQITRQGKKQTVRMNRAGAFKVIVSRSLKAVASGATLPRQEAEAAFRLAKDVLDGKDVQTRAYNYKYAYTAAEVEVLLTEVLQRCKTEEKLVFDIETSGFHWWRKKYHPHVATTLSCSFCFQVGEVFAVSLRTRGRSEKVLSLLKEILEHPIRKGGHNGKFDNVFVRGEMSIRVREFYWDTMLAAFVLNQEGDLGLDKLCPAIRPDLGAYWIPMEKHLDKVYGYLKAPDKELLEYNARDVDATMSLWLEQEKAMAMRGKEEIFRITMKHAAVAESCEFHGVPVDEQYAISTGKSMLAETRRLEQEALASIGRHPHWWNEDDLVANGLTPASFKPFNMGSGPQLVALLFDELKLPPTNYSDKTKAPSTDGDSLKAIRHLHPFVDLLVKWKKLSKLQGYIGWEFKKRPKGGAMLPGFESPWEPEGVAEIGKGLLTLLGADGRVRPNFRIEGAATARISITAPALQTIPKTKEFRNIFRAKEGWVFVDCDYKAVELRILAMLTNDPAWLQIFRDGIDPHSVTASKMFGIPLEKVEKDGPERKAAKAVNFGIPYGEGAEGLSGDLKVPKAEAQKWLDDWNKAFPMAAAWLDKQIQDVRKQGFCRYSLNRERPLGGIFSKDRGSQGEAERAAKNTPIQGTAGDCTSIAMDRVHQRLAKEYGAAVDDTARLVLEVHDQLVVECRIGEARKVLDLMIEEMSAQMPHLPPTLPLEVDGEIKVQWGVALKEEELVALLGA